jgi:lysyl-tRNA synthetase class 1
LRGYAGQDEAQRLANAVWHIHGGQPPASDMVVPFAMLLNLAAVSGAEEKGTLWKYLRRYAPEASPETHPGLDAAAGHAVRYFQKHVKPTRIHRLPTDKERAAMEDLLGRLRAHEGSHDPEELQTIVYAVGNEHGFQPLRDWFKALYEVLIGASEGPRFGGFVALYGVAETERLIETALAGGLADEAA